MEESKTEEQKLAELGYKRDPETCVITPINEEPPPPRKSSWTFNAKDNTLTHPANWGYEIDLDRCQTLAELGDWVLHLCDKIWITPNVMMDFVEDIHEHVGKHNFYNQRKSPEQEFMDFVKASRNWEVKALLRSCEVKIEDKVMTLSSEEFDVEEFHDSCLKKQLLILSMLFDSELELIVLEGWDLVDRNPTKSVHRKLGKGHIH